MSKNIHPRNRDLAMKAKLSVSEPRASRMMQQWLLSWGSKYWAEAEEAVALVEASTKLLGMDPDGAVDWDAVAHCVAWSLHNDFTESGSYRLDFIQLESGFWDNLPEDTKFKDIMRSIFGDRFKGNPYIANHCDVFQLGKAALVRNAPQ